MKCSKCDMPLVQKQECIYNVYMHSMDLVVYWCCNSKKCELYGKDIDNLK